MAFTAKDGSKHTNHDSMKRADSKPPVAHQVTDEEPAEPHGEGPQEGGAMQPEDLMNAFEQHMQEHASGQLPDPHNSKRLADHFNKFAAQAHGEHDGY